MNEATFDKLEFDKIKETLASHCATAIGKHHARSIVPARKLRLVRKWLAQVQELLGIADGHGMPPMGGVFDVRNAVRAAAFPTPLEAEELAKIADTLAATASLATWFDRLPEQAEFLRELGQRVTDLSPIADAIKDAIDAKGTVRDGASPKLASIRRSIDETRGKIRGVFDHIIRHSSLARMLQYAGTTFHGDRMVLPLKSEHRGRIKGIIHRSSDTGATLFVEPSESVELNNSTIRLRDQESKEVSRILHLLTQKVNANAATILATLQAIGVMDMIAAKTRYALHRDCICPELSADGLLDLHDARHPLLIELFDHDNDGNGETREVVPIDMRLGDDFDVLIVTGPNTGGKTVALKSVGLLALMTQCGIPIPVGKGSTMPVFQDIFLDIGDEQSLQQSLSTFSSHLSTLLKCLRESGPRTLVLIDELGAGTDPDEGAAIGQAIVTELLALKAKAIITTHLSALKAVAFTAARVDNAAVEFDPKSLKPTYHVRLGEPGNSNALIIAKRLGMPARIVQQAKQYLDQKTQALSKAIAGTLQSRRQAEQARKEAREATLLAEQERENLQRRTEELARSQQEFEQWTAWVNNLKPGDEVFVKTLRGQAKVVRMQMQKQTALVSSGAMDIEVPLRDVDRPQDPNAS